MAANKERLGFDPLAWMGEDNKTDSEKNDSKNNAAEAKVLAGDADTENKAASGNAIKCTRAVKAARAVKKAVRKKAVRKSNTSVNTTVKTTKITRGC